MNLEKVFIGFTKDGEEHLFYRIKKDIVCMDGDYYYIYLDLISGKNYNPCDVDKISLVSYSYILNKKFKTKRKIIKNYKLDREQKIKIADLVLGNICKVRNNVEIASALKSSDIVCLNNEKLERKYHLFIPKNTKAGYVYIDLSTNKKYEKYHFRLEDNDLFVDQIRTVDFNFDEGVKEVSKKLILEKNYKKKNYIKE